METHVNCQFHMNVSLRKNHYTFYVFGPLLAVVD